MALFDRTRDAWDVWRGRKSAVSQGQYQSPLLPEDPRERYELSELYYDGVIYREVNNVLPNLLKVDVESIRELENPTEQAIDFHADHLFPGGLPKALPLVSDNLDLLEPAINTIWITSQWSMNKQVYARWLPLYGDAFLKATQTDRVRQPFMQLTHPKIVSRFDKDDRGNLVYILLETEIDKVGGGILIRNEEWSRDEQKMRVWYAAGYGSQWGDRAFVSEQDVDEDDSGEFPLSSFGIDFVPFVHTVFMPDLNEPQGRGVGAIARKVAQIDEINRMVTRLHDRYFRYGKPDKAVMAGESNKNAPRFQRNDTRPGPAGMQSVDGSVMTLEDGEKVYRFPGMSHMEYLVANLPYEQGLEMIRARQKRLAENWSELRYYEDVDQGDPSGIARRNRLAPAISRSVEARGNAEDGIIRCQKMCLTLGQRANLPDFQNIGSYDAGDFDHSFEEREVLPTSDEEKESALGIKLDNAQKMIVLGRPRSVVRREYLGWEDEAITEDGEPIEDDAPPDDGDIQQAAEALAERMRGGTETPAAAEEE